MVVKKKCNVHWSSPLLAPTVPIVPFPSENNGINPYFPTIKTYCMPGSPTKCQSNKRRKYKTSKDKTPNGKKHWMEKMPNGTKRRMEKTPIGRKGRIVRNAEWYTMSNGKIAEWDKTSNEKMLNGTKHRIARNVEGKQCRIRRHNVEKS
jgi:hypothetical protein